MNIFVFLIMMLSAVTSWAWDGQIMSLSFGTHIQSTIEISQRRLEGSIRSILTYRKGNQIIASRVIPVEMAVALEQDIQRIFKDFKDEIPRFDMNSCAARMTYRNRQGNSPVAYCSDGASVLANKRISDWIRKAQTTVGLRRQIILND